VRQEVEDIVGATLDDSKAMNEGVLEGLRSPFRRHWASSQLRLLPPTTALVTWTAIFSESDLLLFPCYLVLLFPASHLDLVRPQRERRPAERPL
jgi:hypothetical protein